MKFRRGLVVGKFSPLHKGHEYLIEQASAQCEELLLLSYAKPDFPGCSTAVRRGWLEALAPAATTLVVDDHWLDGRREAGLDPPFPAVPHDDDHEDLHRRFTAWLSTDVIGVTCDAVFTSEDYGDGFARILADLFGHPVTHVCVDRARRAIPISATAIRRDARLRSRYLSDSIAGRLPMRFVMLGAESTGKSTLCHAINQRWNEPVAEEYGRELWDERAGQLAFDDMAMIARVQVAREEALVRQSSHFLICDTSPATTAFYSRKLFGRIAPELEQLAERDYDLTFLCQPDIPFVQDGTRQDTAFRAEQHAYYESFLGDRRIPWIALSGSLEHRLATVQETIATITS